MSFALARAAAVVRKLLPSQRFELRGLVRQWNPDTVRAVLMGNTRSLRVPLEGGDVPMAASSADRFRKTSAGRLLLEIAWYREWYAVRIRRSRS